MAPAQHSVRNCLLRSMSPEAFDRIAPLLSRVVLGIREGLEAAGQSVTSCFFFETAIASTLTKAGLEGVEIAMLGRDTASGLVVLHEHDRSAFETFVQAPGEAWKISAADLRRVTQDCPDLRRLMLRAAHAQSIQVACTALANSRFSVIQRLARWLLMCHDRADGDELRLTHALLALMLGVRRAGITTEIHVLEGGRAIANLRGLIVIRDRAKLEAIAGECYGLAEREYERLIGQGLRRPVPSGAAARR